MQNLNIYENQTLLSLQLARLMPNFSAHYANTLLIQTLLNLQAANKNSKALTDSQEAVQTKSGEARFTEDGIKPSETCFLRSGINKDQCSTSPSVLKIVERKKKVSQEHDTEINIKYEEIPMMESCKGNGTVKIEETDGLLKQSKKITKEKISLKNAQKDLNDFDCRENTKKRRGKKPTWKTEEDSRLAQLVELHGQKWTQIASLMGDKTAKQARDRYINFLRPGIESAEWTEDQEKTLELLVEKHGRKWSKIASELPGRTENQVKNKYYCILNKRCRENKVTVVKEENKDESKPYQR